MLFGIIMGSIAAVLQSTSYIFSRLFISRHKSSLYLTVYSQLAMGIMGLVMFAVCCKLTTYPLTWKYALLCLAWITTYITAQFSFFMALTHVEASRLSSLLGTKIITLAAISLLLGNKLNMIQWIAVVLCCISAVGMNFTGGKLSFKSCLWIGSAVLSYSLCDLSCTAMIHEMPGTNITLNSFCVVAISYAALGVLTLPALFFVPVERKLFLAATPFGAAWFISMNFLLTGFGTLGVVYGTIIQSGRGIVSVVLGVLLIHLGFDHLEPRVNKKAWFRRAVMAALMLAAMTLYAKGSAANRKVSQPNSQEQSVKNACTQLPKTSTGGKIQ